jgi:hypothetical protein
MFYFTCIVLSALSPFFFLTNKLGYISCTLINGVVFIYFIVYHRIPVFKVIRSIKGGYIIIAFKQNIIEKTIFFSMNYLTCIVGLQMHSI